MTTQSFPYPCSGASTVGYYSRIDGTTCLWTAQSFPYPAAGATTAYGDLVKNYLLSRATNQYVVGVTAEDGQENVIPAVAGAEFVTLGECVVLGSVGHICVFVGIIYIVNY